MSLCVCVSLYKRFLINFQVIFIKFGMLTASDMRLHHILIIFTLTFKVTHLYYETNKMFDYFWTYSSNTHHVCCEDSPIHGLYDHCQSDDLDLHSRSHVRLKLDYFFYLQYLRQYFSYCIQTWHDGRLMHCLELDLHFENVCKASSSCYIL